MMTVAQLIELWPDIPWRKPQEVRMEGAEHDVHYSCRICLAQQGLRGSDIVLLPKTLEEFELHMKTEHKADS